MRDPEEFHLVEQCHPLIWNAFMEGLRPIFENYLEEERRKLRQQQAPPSIERA